MADANTIRFIVGIMGNVISFFLFLSPLPTFFTIWKEKSVQSFKPDPYVATILNCGMWILYGMPFVHPDSLLVITINSIGLVIEGIYIVIFFIYSDRSKRQKISIALAAETIFMTIVAIATLVFLHGTEERSFLVGMLAIILNIMMYISPLTIMKRVITTKSVKYMPLPLSLASLANGIVWSIYSLMKFDPYILVPNALGIISGIVQIVLYAKFSKTTNWDVENGANNTKVVELQNPTESSA